MMPQLDLSNFALPVLDAELPSAKTTHWVTTTLSGEHDACVSIPSASGNAPVLLSLEVLRGHDEAFFEGDAAAGKKLSEAEAALNYMNELADAILSESDYVKGLEIDFYETSVGMNKQSGVWPLVRVGTMLVVGAVQLLSLRSFFAKKKLV
jgi:hypothetical protein